MGGVGHLVGVHPDIARLDPNRPPVECLRIRRVPAATVEMLAEQWREEPHKGLAAASLHLDQQRLALVQRHAARLTHRLVPPRLRQARLIERVAGLVQHPHQTREGVRLRRSGS